MKIVINRKYGGFGLSYDAVMRYAEIKGIKLYAYLALDHLKEDGPLTPYDPNDSKATSFFNGPYYTTVPCNDAHFFWETVKDLTDIERFDSALVQAVEELGEKANGCHAKLKVVEIPEDVTAWEIMEFDGVEEIHEIHRVWY
jgi:hypothetical protein